MTAEQFENAAFYNRQKVIYDKIWSAEIIAVDFVNNVIFLGASLALPKDARLKI